MPTVLISSSGRKSCDWNCNEPGRRPRDSLDLHNDRRNWLSRSGTGHSITPDRLLKGRGTLINHRQTAEDNFQKRQQEIAAFKETLKGLGSDAVNPTLMSAVDQALKIGDYDEALA